MASLLRPDEAYPLTAGQHADLAGRAVDPQRGVYNIAGAARVRLPLDLPIWRRVIDALVVRHPELRTAIVAAAGVPQQLLVRDQLCRSSAWMHHMG